MKRSIKSIICAASAAVICAAPIAPTFAGLSPVTGITAEAAGFATKSGSFVRFNENQIDVNVVDFNNSASISFDNKTTFSRSNIEPFVKQSVEFDITSSLPQANVEKHLKNIRVNLKSYIDKEEEYVLSQSFIIQYEKMSEVNAVKTYHCTCEFLVYGRSYEASIDNINSKLTLKSGIVSDDADRNYWKVEANTPPGEGTNIYAIIPKKDGSRTLNKDTIKAWAKNTCLVVNSLGELTGNKKDTVYVLFRSSIPDEYRTDRSHDNDNAVTKIPSTMWNKGGENDKYGFIEFCKAEATEKRLLSSNTKKQMSMTLLHELGHSYSFYTGSKWQSRYLFSTSGLSSDEWFTECRTLTALHFCSNFTNDYTVLDQNNNLTTLDKVYSRDYGADAYLWIFYKRLTGNIGYDRLRNFYSVGSKSLNPDMRQTHEIIKKFADKLAATSEFKSLNPSSSNENYIKYVNSLVGLYGYRTGSETELNQFISNLRNDFKDGNKNGLTFLKEMYIWCKVK